jgi:hypothetical protein
MKKKSNGLGKRRKEREKSREREDEGRVGGFDSLVIQCDSLDIIRFFWVNDFGDGEGDDDGEDDDDSDGEKDDDGDGEEDGDRE